MFVERNAKLDILKTFDERLAKVEAMLNHLNHPQVIGPHREATDVTTLIIFSILMLNWKASRLMSSIWGTSQSITFHKLDIPTRQVLYMVRTHWV